LLNQESHQEQKSIFETQNGVGVGKIRLRTPLLATRTGVDSEMDLFKGTLNPNYLNMTINREKIWF